MTKAQKAEQAEAIETLREILTPGSTIYVYCNHVSRSGMSRTLVPLVLDSVPKVRGRGNLPPFLRRIGYITAKALGWAHDKDQGVKVAGCGMDIGFHLVYSLAQTLYPQGFGCIGERCPSSDHTGANGMPRSCAPINHHSHALGCLRCVWI
jgi:hypothetical protein